MFDSIGEKLCHIPAIPNDVLQHLRTVGHSRNYRGVILTSLDWQGVLGKCEDHYIAMHTASELDRRNNFQDRGQLRNMHDATEIKSKDGK